MKTTLATVLTIAIAAGCHGKDKPSNPDTDKDDAVEEAAHEPGEVGGEGGDPTKPPAPGAPAPAPAGQPIAMTFDTDKHDAAPAGFTFGRTGKGGPGKWVVKTEAGAPSGKNVLAQVDTDATDYRFPVAMADTRPLGDVRLSVRCKPVSGKVDQACGLIFRAADADNYYVTRANALENNVRLYHVVKGSRQQFAGWSGKVASGVWHELRVDAKGDHFEVYFDGTRVIDAHDATFTTPGKVGLWTKADSVTYFDDLTATPL